MSDKLEDFIRNHRSELDIDEPSATAWKGIEQQIPSAKKRRLWSIMSAAASVLILVVSAYIIGMNNGQERIDRELFASQTEYTEFQEARKHYITTIDHKMSQAQQMGVEEDVLNDLRQLDEVYEELKEEMITSDYENKEILISLMIKNYKTKIDILERIINKKNNDESNSNRKETISI